MATMAIMAITYGVIGKTLKKRTFFTPLSSDKSSEFRLLILIATH